jgi:O-succinylbenzoic acid--CoA ligase
VIALPTDVQPSQVAHLIATRTAFAASGAPTSDRADVVLLTSGSTGTRRAVGHTYDAIEWAAATANTVLGSDDWQWLLLLSPLSAGGFMTLARTQRPALIYPGPARFDAAQFTGWYRGTADATAMVSTQLARLLAVPEGVELLRRFQVILVGGGPFPAAMRRRCQDLGINAIATYGATETLGGCVYDGVPWPGVDVQLRDGQIHLDGPNLADSYVPGPRIEHPWPTGDTGRFRDGRLEVIGRLDDMVPIKGVNRHLADYEAQALTRPGVVEAVAVAVPDEVDGYRVVVFVEDADQRLPRLTTGKPDRQELLRRARGQRR